jgi:hypothetical protein
MSDPLGNFRQDSLEEPIKKMWRYPVGSSDYNILRGELDQRVAQAQIVAATAQRRSAWYQLAAVVAMFPTVIATVGTPWISYWLSSRCAGS